MALKVKSWRQSLEKDLSCVFKVIVNILLDKGAEPAIKHRQQNTTVRAKGADPIWSQVSSSLLYSV